MCRRGNASASARVKCDENHTASSYVENTSRLASPKTKKIYIAGMPWNHEAVISTHNINTQTSTFHVKTDFEVHPTRTVQKGSGRTVHRLVGAKF